MIASTAVIAGVLLSTVPMAATQTTASKPAAAPAAQRKIARIEAAPAEIQLSGVRQQAQLVVTAILEDGSLLDVTRSAKYQIANPAIVRVMGGKLSPMKDGATDLWVSIDGVDGKPRKTKVGVKVAGAGECRPLNFVNDVVPVLSKYGCNGGGCHGKATGQNGFKLSLFGFDPQFDYAAIVSESFGRRLAPAAPTESLLLQKGIATVPHGGGERFDAQSEAYQLLVDWIAQGAPWGNDKDAKAVGVAVEPAERSLLEKGQQLRVVAKLSDGSSRDVTFEAEYESQQPGILKVTGSGYVESNGLVGEAAVMIRYMGMVTVAKIRVPYHRGVPESAYSGFTPNNFIDDLAMKKWRELGIAPSPECDDAEFIRRAFVDAIGTLPTPDEVRTFLASPAADKREKLVDKILSRPEYADYWGVYWNDLLRNQSKGQPDMMRGSFAFNGWIRNAFAQNMPYDQFVTELLTAQGTMEDNPATVWYRAVRNNIHRVNDTAQLFLGTRMSCANCHHHPYESLGQEDYWGFAAFFARVGAGQRVGGVTDGGVFVNRTGGVSHPRTGKAMKPKALYGQEYDVPPGQDPRAKLAQWMTAPDNRFFARALANRMWGRFMGVGFVEAVDDMRVTNPPSNPALLDALATDFVDHRFDLKHLMKTIMTSKVYGLSAEPTPYNQLDRQNYARYYPRRLSPHALLDAVASVTKVSDRFNGLPVGFTAKQLPDEKFDSYFLDVFGRSMRDSPCECETSYEPNLAQVLHLMNSDHVAQKIADPKSSLSELLQKNTPNDKVVEELYLLAFGRLPSKEESSVAIALAKESKDRKPVFEDLLWSMLNSKEFLFNH